ncbi:MAG: YjbH domain-containing protein [candidate division Zixibacteria bacterium]|nr:YjbH domain-containing protein [candidate division Zixibacteria bacterium]
MMKYLCLIFILLAASVTFGQDDYSDDSELYPVAEFIPPAQYDVRWLIDTPTAYMLPRGSFDLDFRTFPHGGVQAAISIGLADRFSLGLAYGGSRILSEESPEWNSKMEFKIRYMLIEEYRSFPQISVGFSSIGYGLYQERDEDIGYDEDRYLIKSPGFYLCASKRYPVYTSYLSLHGGINYSLESEIDSDPNFFAGALINLGYNMIFLAEYDLAINDNKKAGQFGKGRGYLNLGIAWYITSELQLELDFRNVLLNRNRSDEFGNEDLVIDREVRLVYLQFFTD